VGETATLFGYIGTVLNCHVLRILCDRCREPLIGFAKVACQTRHCGYLSGSRGACETVKDAVESGIKVAKPWESRGETDPMEEGRGFEP